MGKFLLGKALCLSELTHVLAKDSRQVHGRSWRYPALVYCPLIVSFCWLAFNSAAAGHRWKQHRVVLKEDVPDPGRRLVAASLAGLGAWHALVPNPNGPEAEARSESAPASAVAVPVEGTRTDDEKWAAIDESGRREAALQEKTSAFEASRRISNT